MVPPSYLRVKQLKADHKLSAYVRYWKDMFQLLWFGRSSHFTWRVFNISIYRFFILRVISYLRKEAFSLLPEESGEAGSHQNSGLPSIPCRVGGLSFGNPYFYRIPVFIWHSGKESIPQTQLIRSRGSPRRTKGSRVLKEDLSPRVIIAQQKQLILLKGIFP